MYIDMQNPEQVSHMNCILHDSWFDLELIRYDQDKSEWILSFGSRKGPFNQTLTITGVKEYTVHDTERIRIYDINRLVVDTENNVIILKSHIPLGIQLKVEPSFTIRID